MNTSRITRWLAVGLAMALIPGLVFARKNRNDFAEGLGYAESDASPSATTSNVNDYINQDEQINIAPGDGVVKVLRTDQKILVNDYVTAIIPCKNVHPREIRGPIRTMVRKEGGEADVVQDKKSGLYYLHVVCPRFQLPYVQECIAGLDEKWVRERNDGSGEMYYKAKFRDIRKIRDISQFYISPEGAGQFYIDDLANSMYYTDQPALMDLQSWGLKQIDIPANQVSLEIALYEINMNNDTRLGLDWNAWKNGPGRNLLEFAHMSEKNRTSAWNSSTNQQEVTNSNKRFSLFQVNALAASQFLDFVQNKGYVREVIRTRILLKSGDPGLIEAVDAVAQFSSSTAPPAQGSTPIVDKDGTPINDVNAPDNSNRTVDYREANDKVGVRVKLTPWIGLESMELNVEMDASTISGYTPSGNPMLATRNVNNYVRLVNGQPCVIGGLEREITARNKNGAPFLHTLPVLGWLFGNEQNLKRKTQLVAVIKPTFKIGTESVLEMPEDVKTTIALAKGEQSLEIPKNSYGYDQWLFDGE